jgi:hypothetical protein
MKFKGALEVHDYVHDISLELGTDTIQSSTWTLPSGITKQSDSYITGVATIWIEGGTAGQTYPFSHTFVTTEGRTHNKFIDLRIQEQRAG